MIKKLALLLLVIPVQILCMEKDEPEKRDYLSSLPTELKQEIALATSSKNIEEVGKALRNLHIINKQWQEIVDNNTPAIIKQIATVHKIPELLAAQYVGTKQALAWFDQNIKKAKQDDINATIHKAMEHFSGSTQSVSIINLLLKNNKMPRIEFYHPPQITKDKKQISFVKTNNNDICFVRINIDKTIDNTFGHKGVACLDRKKYPGEVAFYTLQSTGDIIVLLEMDDFYFNMIRLKQNGIFDTSFKPQKIFSTYELKRMFTQLDGTIVIFFQHGLAFDRYFSIFLISHDGTIRDQYSFFDGRFCSN